MNCLVPIGVAFHASFGNRTATEQHPNQQSSHFSNLVSTNRVSQAPVSANDTRDLQCYNLLSLHARKICIFAIFYYVTGRKPILNKTLAEPSSFTSASRYIFTAYTQQSLAHCCNKTPTYGCEYFNVWEVIHFHIDTFCGSHRQNYNLVSGTYEIN